MHLRAHCWCHNAHMELANIISPFVSLVVGFFGALFGARQANAVWQRDQNEKRILALRNYERALYDMALYLEGIEISDLAGHPEPKDLEEKRQVAFPYFVEFEGRDYYKLLAPHPGPGNSAMEDSDAYAEASRIIKNKLESEKQKPSKTRLPTKLTRRFLKSGTGKQIAENDTP